MKYDIAILGYYHGPKLGVGVYLDRFISTLNVEEGERRRILFYTNKNTLKDISSPLHNLTVKTPRMLSMGTVPAILWMSFLFPLVCLIGRCRVGIIMQNPTVLFRWVRMVSAIMDLNEFEIDEKYGRLRSIYRKHIMIRSALANSTGVVALSQFVERQIGRHFGSIGQDRLRVISPGVDVCETNNDAEQSCLDRLGLESEGYLLTVGRLDPRSKNLYRTVDLFREALRSKADLKMVFVGGINESTRSDAEIFLNNIKADSVLSGRVLYPGFVSDEDLAILYKNACAVVFMSRFEGFGFPLIEAFKLGCPVIYNSACEVLRDHADDAAIAIDERRLSRDVVTKMRILFDPEQRTMLKSRMAEVARRYEWSKTVASYMSFVDELTEECI